MKWTDLLGQSKGGIDSRSKKMSPEASGFQDWACGSPRGMGRGGKRAIRVGAYVARLVSRSWRDVNRQDGFRPLVGNHQALSAPARNSPTYFSTIRHLRGSRKSVNENLFSFIGIRSSLWVRRTFVARSNRGRGYTFERVSQGNPEFNSRWFVETARVPKVKPAGASTGGGIGAGGQLAAASLVSGSICAASISLAGQNGVLQVLRFYGNCYRQLSKAHLSSFVVSTAAVGFVMGSGEVVDWMGLVWTSVSTMLAASSANAFNQILEVTNDGRMKRTRRRPLPSGRMSKGHALAFALIAGITGVALLACKTSAVAAELAAANIVLYSLVYTPLKQIHYINTWVGAVVGGIPPLLGWSAASGQVDAGAWVLAGALYFWQIPHFMSLAFLFRGDYMAGGYKMLSLLDSSGKRTASCALRNCVYLLPLGFLAQHWGTTSGYFGVENLVLTAGIGATAATFYVSPGPASARKLFRTSLLYLPILMTAMVVHRIPNPKVKTDQLSVIDTDQIGELNDCSLGLLSDSPTSADSDQRTVAQRKRPSPPISLLSAAPFPFLPAPDYP